MAILLRFAVMAAVIILIIYLLRPFLLRAASNPGWRYLLSRIGPNVFGLLMLRRLAPLLLRAVRALFMFR